MPLAGGQVADCLHSWKEVAAHLRHSVRTVQRWEQVEGMPVHRHAHEKRDAVYAYKSELDAWWKEREARLGEEAEGRLAAAPVIEMPTTRRPVAARRAWLVGGAAALLLMAAAGVWIARSKGSSVSFAARDWVVIADFENQTGDALFDRSLWTALTASLQQSAHVNIVSRSRMDAALRRMGKEPDARIGEQLGRELCLRENARLLLAGGIARFGREYGLSARLIDPDSGEALRTYFERAKDQNEILASLGRITSRIREDLGESLASIRRVDRPLPQVTTSSLQALRAYAEGGHLWRKRQYREAVKLFESALVLDPDFAMAHAALASAYLSHIFFEPAQAKEHYDRALRRTERISERERLYIQAAYHSSLNHLEEALRLYKLYLAAYPDDLGARQGLGNLLMRHDRLPGAVEQFREVVRIAPSEAGSFINLATSFRLLGKPNEALANYAKAFELEPGWVTSGNVNHEYGFGLVQSGNVSKAREVFALALAKPEMKSSGLRSLALLDMYEGRYRDAKARLREAIALSVAERERLREARNHLFMSILLDGQGDAAGCLKELDRAVQTRADLPVWLVARVGAAYARAGAVGKAEQTLRGLAQRVDQNSPKERSELHVLEGELAAARGEHGRAIEKLQTADQEARSPLTLAALARAYQVAGQTGQAVATYETLIAMSYPALGWEPQQSWIAAHAELAELYLARRDRDKATQVLGILARLWKEADRDLPLVKRMERLEREARRVPR